MGKKSLCKKGQESGKGKIELNDLEVSDSKRGLCKSSNNGSKSSKDDNQNDKRQQIRGYDADFGATQKEFLGVEAHVDVNNTEMERDQKRKFQMSEIVEKVHKARKKHKKEINIVEEVSEVKEVLMGENMSRTKSDEKDLGKLAARKDRKKKHREDKKYKIYNMLGNEGQKIPEEEDIAKMDNGQQGDINKEQKMKKPKNGKNGGDLVLMSCITDVAAFGKESEHLNENTMKQVVQGQKSCQKEDAAKVNKGQEEDPKEMKKKRGKSDGGGFVMNGVTNGKEFGEESEQLDGNVPKNVGFSGKGRKRKEKKNSNDFEAASLEIMPKKPRNKSSIIEDKEYVVDEGTDCSMKCKSGAGKLEVHTVNAEGGNKNKRKRNSKLAKISSELKVRKPMPRSNTGGETTSPSEESAPKGTSKRVSFSDHVEIFPSDGSCDEDGFSEGNLDHEKGLVQGKRFSPEEDELVKEAVYNFIKTRGLGEEGVQMVMHCKSHPEIRRCWKEIATALPWRPYTSVYYRAHTLFERDEAKEWTPEEVELVRKFYEKHGADWKTLADALGKHRVHVKDLWRRVKLPNVNKGHWSQEEYQKLFDLVNMDLRMKAFEERKSKHGMLRDNICWGSISDQLGTRINVTCCLKWYRQITSPMVVEGKWADADDYRLVNELFVLDPTCMEDVDWDNLLVHRSGEVCRKRWGQMVRHIGEHRNKSFAEQIEILYKRYCPEVLEAREAYDSKPAVD